MLLFINQWLPDNLVRTVCWTLIHSLWQGLLLAITAGTIMLLTKKNSAVARYNLLAVSFLLFILTICCTFAWQWQQAAYSDGANVAARQHDAPATDMVLNAGNEKHDIIETDYAARFAAYFNRHAALIVVAWFIIFSAKCVKIISGLVYIQRLRHYKTCHPTDYWKQRMQELAASLQIRQQITLLQSGLVKVPVVIGFLKPVVLVPLALLTHLPQDQLEAILLHELAHIKRRDYFVNLVQSFAETVFFFNPAVLWVSALIREERENCCDDMAIARTNNKTRFIDALVSFQEYNINAGYAMAFPGRKDHLLNRVKRIVHNSNKTLSAIEKAFVIGCFLLTGAFAWIFARPVQKMSAREVMPFVKNAADSSFNKMADSSIDKSMQGYTNNRPHPVHDTLPVRMNRPVKREQAGAGTKPSPDTVNSMVRLDSIDIKLSKLDADLERQNPVTSRLHYKPALLHYKPTPLQAASPMPIATGKPFRKGEPVDLIFADLVAANLAKENAIKDKENFSFILNNDELLVDGVKQPDAIFQKFKAKYISPTGRTTHSYIYHDVAR
jgi:bla regulator protein BlaR1